MNSKLERNKDQQKDQEQNKKKDIIILIKNLSKTYKDNKNLSKNKLALNDLNLEIERGKIFGLIGENGAGKSTLINILAKSVVKDSGSVFIDDINLDEEPKKFSMQVGIVPQEIIVDPFFPIEQSLKITSGYYGVKYDQKHIHEILKIMRLYEKRNNLPRQLSGGMKRRYLIAKAMVHNPKLLILDEPTAGVDIKLREDLWSYIKKLNQLGTTIIITTHYLQEAEELCDEIAFIDEGKIICVDKTKNLLKNFGDQYINIYFKNKINLSQIEQINKSISSNHPKFKNSISIYEDFVKINNNNNNQNELNDIMILIIEIIKNNQINIDHIETSRNSLEDVFRKIIKDKV